MQALPDRDFEKAFQQKFETFEVAPSPAVWRDITSVLDNKRKRKSFPFLKLAAACVLLATGAALWLSAPEEKTWLRGETHAVVTVEDVVPQVSNPTEKEIIISTVKIPGSRPQASVVKRTAAVKHTEIKDIKPEVIQAAVVPQQTEPPRVQLPVPVEQKPSVLAEVPVNSLTDIKTNEPADDESVITKKRRIKNVGDFVNLVMDKVDPRRDKLIRFSDDGEGGSQVSGINLGILNIKSVKE
jgi:cytoskeletal protein RodZ